MPTQHDIRTMARRYFRDADAAPRDLVQAVESGLDHGLNLQHDAFDSDSDFRLWVLRDNYLDLDACYTHPDFFVAVADTAFDWRSRT